MPKWTSEYKNAHPHPRMDVRVPIWPPECAPGHQNACLPAPACLRTHLRLASRAQETSSLRRLKSSIFADFELLGTQEIHIQNLPFFESHFVHSASATHLLLVGSRIFMIIFGKVQQKKNVNIRRAKFF